MIGDSELDGMRQAFLNSLTDSAQVYRPTNVSDAQGGHTQTEGLPWTEACRLHAGDRRPGMSMLAQRLGERIANREVYVIYLGYNSTVAVEDRLVIGGRSFRALALLHGTYNISRRAVAILEGA